MAITIKSENWLTASYRHLMSEYAWVRLGTPGHTSKWDALVSNKHKVSITLVNKIKNITLADHLRVFSRIFKVADHEYGINFARLTLF